MDEKNKKLIAIFKQSLAVDEEIKNLAKAIQGNIRATDKSIEHTRKMLETLNQELIKIKENEKIVTPKLATMIDISTQINNQSDKIQRSIMESIESIASNKVQTSLANEKLTNQTSLANEKLTKLIDILKAIAMEQGKVDKVLQGQEKLDVIIQAQGKVTQATQGQSQSKIDQVLQGMKKLDLLLQAQENLDQVLQGQGLASITSEETISHVQQEIKDALADLRRKANVNISRNDDILKKIKK
jgi:hypothetical protein